MMEPTMLIFLSVRFPITSALTFQVQGNDSNLICQLWQSNFFFSNNLLHFIFKTKKIPNVVNFNQGSKKFN